jgi:3-phosphoglycerate kinase
MSELDRILRFRQLDFQGRRVWLRADLDSARSPWGVPLDDAPLRELLPTLRALIGQRAKVIA